MILPIFLLSCFLLASSAAPTPLEIADSFQSTLNRAIIQKNQHKINDILDAHFYETPCKGNRVEKDAFSASLISSGRAGVVTGARNDGYYIYYSVNYGDKWSMVYLLNSKVYWNLPRKLIFAKQIDCKFVDK